MGFYAFEIEDLGGGGPKNLFLRIWPSLEFAINVGIRVSQTYLVS